MQALLLPLRKIISLKCLSKESLTIQHLIFSAAKTTIMIMKGQFEILHFLKTYELTCKKEKVLAVANFFLDLLSSFYSLLDCKLQITCTTYLYKYGLIVFSLPSNYWGTNYNLQGKTN